MLTKRIKNADSVDHIWVGQGISPSEYYDIQPSEEKLWINDQALLTDISNGIAVVNNGVGDLTTLDGLNYIGLTTDPTDDLFTYNPMQGMVPVMDDTFNMLTWSPATSGTGAAASASGGNAVYASGNHLGVASVSTGTTATGSACLNWSGSLSTSIVFSGGQFEYRTLVLIPILATAAQDYIIRIGLGTSATADHANGIYFEYNRANSANWAVKTASLSARTTTVTSSAVTANTWQVLRFIVNATGTNVDFFRGPNFLASISTNIPTTIGQGCGGNYQIIKSNGTQSRELVADFFYMTKKFTNRITG